MAGGQGSINMPQSGSRAGIEGILAALSAIHLYYGINTEREKAEVAKIQTAQAQANADPTSNSSKLAQLTKANEMSTTGKILGFDKEKESGKRLQAALGLVSGTPEVGKPGDADYKAAVPGMSQNQIASNADSGDLALAKGKQAADASAIRLQGLVKTKEEANQMRLSSVYDSVIKKPYEDRLDAANRVKVLLSNAMSGNLIPSEYLGSQLANDLNLLQSSGGRATVSGTEHNRPNTLFGKAGSLVHFASGDPQAAITQGDMGQMSKETNLLYEEIGNQHQSKFKSWIKGQPNDLRPLLIDRFNTSRSEYFPGTAVASPSSSGGSPLPGSNAQAGTNPPPKTYDPDVIDYAKTHGISNDQAQIVKQTRGGR